MGREIENNIGADQADLRAGRRGPHLHYTGTD